MVRILNRTRKNMFVLNFFLYILTKLIAYSVKRWNIVSIPILFGHQIVMNCFSDTVGLLRAFAVT